MKKYNLKIEDASNDDHCWLRSKGHHNKEEFLKAYEEYDPRGTFTEFEHAWVKNVPDSTGWYSVLHVFVKEGVRGAYPATYVRSN